jgi:hypothetical protein
MLPVLLLPLPTLRLVGWQTTLDGASGTSHQARAAGAAAADRRPPRLALLLLLLLLLCWYC